MVDGGLQAEIVILHKDDNHIVRVASSLLDIIREDILKKFYARFREKFHQNFASERTFDQVTRSFAP